MTDLTYTIEPEVFDAFPGYIRGVVLVWDCDNTDQTERLRGMVDAAAAGVAADASLDPPASSPDVAAWRTAFSRFGATPSKFPSSLEALLKRARRGDVLPYINDLVALGTYLTLRHRLPTGGHDLDRVNGDLRLKLARGDEEFVPLGGGPAEHPVPGEVILCDSVQVLCRRWVWRQADVDKVTPATRRLVINFDGLPPTGGLPSTGDLSPADPGRGMAARVAAAMNECEGLVRTLLGASTRRLILSSVSPAASLGVTPT